MKYCRENAFVDVFRKAGIQASSPTVESRGQVLCRAVFLSSFVPPSELQDGWSWAPAASSDTQVPQSRKLILQQMCLLHAASRSYITPSHPHFSSLLSFFSFWLLSRHFSLFPHLHSVSLTVVKQCSVQESKNTEEQ